MDDFFLIFRCVCGKSGKSGKTSLCLSPDHLFNERKFCRVINLVEFFNDYDQYGF